MPPDFHSHVARPFRVSWKIVPAVAEACRRQRQHWNNVAQTMPMYSPDGRISPEGTAAVKRVLPQSIEKVRQANIDPEKSYTNKFLTAP